MEVTGRSPHKTHVLAPDPNGSCDLNHTFTLQAPSNLMIPQKNIHHADKQSMPTEFSSLVKSDVVPGCLDFLRPLPLPILAPRGRTANWTNRLVCDYVRVWVHIWLLCFVVVVVV